VAHLLEEEHREGSLEEEQWLEPRAHDHWQEAETAGEAASHEHDHPRQRHRDELDQPIPTATSRRGAIATTIPGRLSAPLYPLCHYRCANSDDASRDTIARMARVLA
jgi:hypothetical protein